MTLMFTIVSVSNFQFQAPFFTNILMDNKELLDRSLVGAYRIVWV